MSDTNLIELHRRVRTAHAIAARATVDVAKHYEGMSVRTAQVVEKLQMLHAIMDGLELMIREEIDGTEVRTTTPTKRDHQVWVSTRASEMHARGSAPAAIASCTGFSDSRSLYRFLRAAGRADLAETIKTGKKAQCASAPSSR